MSAAKDKGTKAERPVAEWFAANGFPRAARLVTAGRGDRGDIGGIPATVIEVKDVTRRDIPGWLRETERERINAGAVYGVLIVKPIGVPPTRVGEWWAILPVDQLGELLRRSGLSD